MRHVPPTDKQLAAWEAEAIDPDKSVDKTVLALIQEVRRLRFLMKRAGRLTADIEQAVIDHGDSVVIRVAADKAWEAVEGKVVSPAERRRLWLAKVGATHKAKLTRQALEGALAIE